MTFELLSEVPAHKGPITSITPNPAVYDQFCTTSRDRTTTIWQTFAGQDPMALPQTSFHGHNGIIEDAAYFPSGSHVMTAAWDNSMRLWSLDEKKSVARFTGHSKDVLAVDVVLGRYIVSGSRDKSIRVWNIHGEVQSTLSEHSDWVSCIKACPTSTGVGQFASGSWDQTVKLWTISEQSEGAYDIRVDATLLGHNSQVHSIDYLYDGSVLFTAGGNDQKVALWDVPTCNHLMTLNVEEAAMAVASQPIHRMLAVCCPTSVKVFDMRTRKQITQIMPETEGEALPTFTSVAWSANGDTLITGASDGVLRMYSAMSV